MSLVMPPRGIIKWCVSDVCLTTSVCLFVAYIMNIHGAHSYWKQGALGAAGVRCVWAGAGLQRAAYRGGGILCGLAHSLFYVCRFRYYNRTTAVNYILMAFPETIKTTISMNFSPMFTGLSVTGKKPLPLPVHCSSKRPNSGQFRLHSRRWMVVSMCFSVDILFLWPAAPRVSLSSGKTSHWCLYRQATFVRPSLSVWLTSTAE